MLARRRHIKGTSHANQKKAVFFDRDNTLIIDKVYLNNPNDIDYLDGAFESVKDLYSAGFKIIIVTNQSGVPRGLVQLENLHEIHLRMKREFSRHGAELAGFYYAPHLPESNHPMRKPNPGMLLQAAREHSIDLSESWMVGDRWSDVQAGDAAGTKSIFLEVSEPPPSEDESGLLAKTLIAKNLLQVRDFILGG